MCLSSSCGQEVFTASPPPTWHKETSEHESTDKSTSRKENAEALCSRYCFLFGCAKVGSKQAFWLDRSQGDSVETMGSWDASYQGRQSAAAAGCSRRRQKWDDDKEVVVDSGTATVCGVNSCHLKVVARPLYWKYPTRQQHNVSCIDVLFSVRPASYPQSKNSWLWKRTDLKDSDELAPGSVRRGLYPGWPVRLASHFIARISGAEDN